jgi:SAM-dependent methyltransferase
LSSYADITTEDPNAVKRWLQNRRLDDALWRVEVRSGSGFAGRMLDFGGGDGALCRRFLTRFPAATAISFDPSATMLEQAAERAGRSPVLLTGSTASIDSASIDLITCCEVFEHLPATQVDEALSEISRLLSATGTLVLGVPNELYLMALAKGVFRMSRRNGQYDARWDTVLPAAKGHPRADRPELDLDGYPFIFPHTGFDYRTTVADLRNHGFRVEATHGSPIRRGPHLVHSELYFVCRKVLVR